MPESVSSGRMSVTLTFDFLTGESRLDVPPSLEIYAEKAHTIPEEGIDDFFYNGLNFCLF